MDLKKRLAQLDRLSRSTKSESRLTEQVSAATKTAALVDLGLARNETPDGPVWCRQYSDDLAGPTLPLPDLREFFSRTVDFPPGPADLLFLDTETTGLAGGTGTIPFLVGVSWWEDGALTTRQYFLPDPGHEAAMLQDLARLADGFRVVLTFNGASFDLPLLRTRARMNRLGDPLGELVVWDLLVPARRLYGNRLPDCRQQTLEREVCDLQRQSGDIDGSRIPQTWFDFLGTGRVGLLPRVMTHNQRDMVGMGRLFEIVVRAAHRLAMTPCLTEGLDWKDGWALGRICERRKTGLAALDFLGFAVASAPGFGSEGMGDPRFVADALRILKRGQDWPLVEQVIRRGLDAGIDLPWLHREAAILYEHRLVDIPKALDHAVKSGEDHRVQRLQARGS
jgi:uncharacterized protein YprB with RNaseH-like and TPR domain